MGALHKNRFIIKFFIFFTFLVAAAGFGFLGEAAASNCAVGADVQATAYHIAVTGTTCSRDGGACTTNLGVSVDAVEGAKGVSWVTFALNGQTVDLAAIRAANPLWTDIDIKNGLLKFGDFTRNGEVFGIEPGSAQAAIAIPQFVNPNAGGAKAGCSTFDVAITNNTGGVVIIPNPANPTTLQSGELGTIGVTMDNLPDGEIDFTILCFPEDRVSAALGECHLDALGFSDQNGPINVDIFQCDRASEAAGLCTNNFDPPPGSLQVEVNMHVDLQGDGKFFIVQINAQSKAGSFSVQNNTRINITN